MEKIPPADQNYKLWLLLAQTKAALFKAREKKIGHYVHHSQAIALVFIWTYNGAATPSMLSQVLSLEVQSVSGLINRMEKKGYVTRYKDPERKNVIRLALTEKGLQTAREVRQLDFVEAAMSRLSAEQQEQLKNCLTILLDFALEEVEKEDRKSAPPNQV